MKRAVIIFVLLALFAIPALADDDTTLPSSGASAPSPAQVQAQKTQLQRMQKLKAVQAEMASLQEQAAKDDMKSEYVLAQIYRDGEDGVKQDYALAVQWYTKVAEHAGGSEEWRVDAESNLGNLYEFGKGVKTDYQQALDWYLKAAAQGDAKAQYHAGMLYSNPLGNVARNNDEAARWFKRAANQGNTDAQFELAYCYNEGRGVNQTTEKAYFWLVVASGEGFKAANFGKGVLRSELERNLDRITVYQLRDDAAEWSPRPETLKALNGKEAVEKPLSNGPFRPTRD